MNFIQENAVLEVSDKKGLFYDMLKRIITAIVAVIILLPILWFSETYVFTIAIAIVSCISLFEIFSCLGFKTKFSVTLPAYIIAIAVPIWGKYAGGAIALMPTVCAALMLYIFYLLALSVICHSRYSIHELAVCYITSVYIICGFSSIQFLREMSSNIYLLVFIGAWVTDIFAYFTGVFFGKHKLCETISPKKTIEGSLGGIVFCSLAFVAFGLFAGQGRVEIYEYIILAVIGIIISVVSQIGDLSMSLIKRHYGIKDFGKIFPGHGGMLDRFDSIIAVSSVLFILLSALKSFNIIIF